MELRGVQTHQPRMKNANGNVLQITPYLFWDLNFHFIFNKSLTVHWQMSWAIFRGVTIFKIRRTHGQSWLFTLSKEKHKAGAHRWISCQGLGSATRISAPLWAQGVPDLGSTSGTFPRWLCSALPPMQYNISTIKQAISFNMENCKSETSVKTEEQMAC